MNGSVVVTQSGPEVQGPVDCDGRPGNLYNTRALMAGFPAEGHTPWPRSVHDSGAVCFFAPRRQSQLTKYWLGLCSDEKQGSYSPSAQAHLWEAGNKLWARHQETDDACSSLLVFQGALQSQSQLWSDHEPDVWDWTLWLGHLWFSSLN